MAEEYAGTKFEVEFLEGEREMQNAAELIKWCREFHSMGVASPGGDVAGNISVRTGRGFLITPSGRNFSSITEDELVEVVEVNEASLTIRAIGDNEPSSEAFLHAGIYGARSDVSAVLHGHNAAITKHASELGIVETEKERPYGTLALKDEVLKVLSGNNVLQMKGHGFIALGATLEEAGQRAVELNKKAEEAEG